MPTIVRFAAALLLAPILLAGCCDDCDDDQFGTITIDPEPNSIDAPWQITGPDGFSQYGNGNLTLLNMAIGSYTITWADVSDWTTPDPAVETQTLETDEALVFTAIYLAQYGTITIDPEPNDINAPWTITSPGGFSHMGNGDIVLGNLIAGSYTLSWGAVTGWTPPDPATVTQTLPANESLTFTGRYDEILEFPDTPDKLMQNFRIAYGTMDFDDYRDGVLSEDYTFVLQAETVEEFELSDNIYEYADELVIAEKMFSGQPNADQRVLSAIEIQYLQPQGAWLPVSANDPYFGGFPGAHVRVYAVLIYFNCQGNFRYEVQGDQLFYVTSEEVMHNGIMTPRYWLLGQLDQTGAAPWALLTESTTWGAIKVIWR